MSLGAIRTNGMSALIERRDQRRRLPTSGGETTSPST